MSFTTESERSGTCAGAARRRGRGTSERAASSASRGACRRGGRGQLDDALPPLRRAHDATDRRALSRASRKRAIAPFAAIMKSSISSRARLSCVSVRSTTLPFLTTVRLDRLQLERPGDAAAEELLRLVGESELPSSAGLRATMRGAGPPCGTTRRRRRRRAWPCCGRARDNVGLATSPSSPRPSR